MLENTLLNLPNSFGGVEIDKYTIMPDHVHFIIAIDNLDIEPVFALRRKNTDDVKTAYTIGDMVRAFKSKTAVKYISGVKNGVYKPFRKRIWQRNYYEHIIRDIDDYQRICKYIEENPFL